MYWSMLLGARAIEVNKTGRNSCSSHAYVLVGREGHLKKKKSKFDNNKTVGKRNTRKRKGRTQKWGHNWGWCQESPHGRDSRAKV